MSNENVKRYDLEQGDDYGFMEKAVDGDYVEFEDYDELATRVKEFEDVAKALTKKPKMGLSIIQQINRALMQNSELSLRTNLNKALKKAGYLE